MTADIEIMVMQYACLLVWLLIAEGRSPRTLHSHHCCLSRANREHSATVLFDHSLMSSVHLHLGLPRLLFPSSLPSSISVHRFLALITWLKYWSLRRCTVVSRRSCGCTSCSTDTLVRCAVQLLTLSNFRYAVISKPCIRRLSTATVCKTQ